MPTPCPSRLKELIALANLEPDSEARKHLQTIARAFKAKRQGKSKPVSILLETKRLITVGVSDGTISIVPGEVELALAQVEPPSRVGFIRECPKCLELFWAGRKDKEACARHADALRKKAKRHSIKTSQVERDKRAAKRKAVLVNKPLQWSKRSNTTKAVISAIMNQNRVFWRIDNWVVSELKWQLKAPVVSRRIVKQCLDSLVKEDFLTYHPHPQDEDSDEERDPLEDRWAPTQKLINRLAGVRPKKPTH